MVKKSENIRAIIIIIALFIVLGSLSGYLLSKLTKPSVNDYGKNESGLNKSEIIGMANPASVYCIESGGNLSIRTDANGGQYGVCMFADGTECEEWRYLNNNGTC